MVELLLVLGIYFLPTVIACCRKHINATAISVLNLVLGWTLVGWLAALVWSFTTQAVPKKEVKALEPKTGVLMVTALVGIAIVLLIGGTI